jgi:hypothetical protein
MCPSLLIMQGQHLHLRVPLPGTRAGAAEYACGATQVVVAARPVIGAFSCATTLGAANGTELSDLFALQVTGVVGAGPFRYSFSHN